MNVAELCHIDGTFDEGEVLKCFVSSWVPLRFTDCRQAPHCGRAYRVRDSMEPTISVMSGSHRSHFRLHVNNLTKIAVLYITLSIMPFDKI